MAHWVELGDSDEEGCHEPLPSLGGVGFPPPASVVKRPEVARTGLEEEVTRPRVYAVAVKQAQCEEHGILGRTFAVVAHQGFEGGACR